MVKFAHLRRRGARELEVADLLERVLAEVTGSEAGPPDPG
jgi:hypothetical protein